MCHMIFPSPLSFLSFRQGKHDLSLTGFADTYYLRSFTHLFAHSLIPIFSHFIDLSLFQVALVCFFLFFIFPSFPCVIRAERGIDYIYRLGIVYTPHVWWWGTCIQLQKQASLQPQGYSLRVQNIHYKAIATTRRRRLERNKLGASMIKNWYPTMMTPPPVRALSHPHPVNGIPG